MAHGQSDQIRRAGWLVAVCGLTAAIGCHGPEKDDPVKRLDPSTRQQLLGVSPPAKPGTGNAGLDQRFNRTTPTSLPAPQLGSTPTPPAPPPPVSAISPNPNPLPGPNPVGLVSAPTRVNNPASFDGPRSANAAPPPPLAEPVIRQTSGISPKMPALIPNAEGMPDVGAVPPITPPPPPSSPKMPAWKDPAPPSDLSRVPLPPVPAMPSTTPPPPVPDPLVSPPPGFSASNYSTVQSPTEVPPLFVK